MPGSIAHPSKRRDEIFEDTDVRVKKRECQKLRQLKKAMAKPNVSKRQLKNLTIAFHRILDKAKRRNKLTTLIGVGDQYRIFKASLRSREGSVFVF